MATLVREGIDRVVGQDDWQARRKRALASIGKFRSGYTDISENHDEYLAEDFLDWRS